MRAQSLRERLLVLELPAKQNFRRSLLRRVVLHDERGKSFLRLRQRGAWEVTRGAEVSATAHEHHAHRILAGLANDSEDVHVTLVISGNDLLDQDPLQRSELIAKRRRPLELEPA